MTDSQKSRIYNHLSGRLKEYRLSVVLFPCGPRLARPGHRATEPLLGDYAGTLGLLSGLGSSASQLTPSHSWHKEETLRYAS